jgi:hypothetical protein
VLYEKTYAVVYTYLIRLTGDRELTDELILDVYQHRSDALKGLSYSKMAAQWDEPPGTIESRIRSGLAKLHRALKAGGDEA